MIYETVLDICLFAVDVTAKPSRLYNTGSSENEIH